MKDNPVLYSIIILTVISICAVLIASATQKRPMRMPKQQARVTTPTPSATTATTIKRKKNCSCCVEKLRALRIQMQKVREAREAQKLQVNEKSRVVSPL